MFKRYLGCFLIGCAVIFAASCTAKNEPKDDAPGKDTPIVQVTPAPKESPPAKANPREVTVHVDGMSEQLKLI
jgi:hypothetical protein